MISPNIPTLARAFVPSDFFSHGAGYAIVADRSLRHSAAGCRSVKALALAFTVVCWGQDEQRHFVLIYSKHGSRFTRRTISLRVAPNCRLATAKLLIPAPTVLIASTKHGLHVAGHFAMAGAT